MAQTESNIIFTPFVKHTLTSDVKIIAFLHDMIIFVMEWLSKKLNIVIFGCRSLRRTH